MVVHRGHERDHLGRLRRRLAQMTGLALGIAMLGTVGLSGALAQEEDVSAGAVDAETIVNSIIEQVWAEIFGGSVVEDDAAVSGGGDLNVGGSTGSTVTMGGGDSGSVTMGGGTGGGVTVGDNTGG
ncbi:MAG TPA: hypothetical protein VHG52_02495 [Thermomicrobiales bacterium]|nr:hypothetical protein [Thermomicrobiales bacterium]